MALGVQREVCVTSEYDTRRTRPSAIAVATGAAAGVLAVYIFSTPAGRRLFNAVIGALDDFSFECARFTQACTRAQIAASGSWQTVKGSPTTSTGGARETVF